MVQPHVACLLHCCRDESQSAAKPLPLLSFLLQMVPGVPPGSEALIWYQPTEAEREYGEGWQSRVVRVSGVTGGAVSVPGWVGVTLRTHTLFSCTVPIGRSSYDPQFIVGEAETWSS